MGLIEGRFEKNAATGAVDRILNLGRKYSLWPMAYGLACCASDRRETPVRFQIDLTPEQEARRAT